MLTQHKTFPELWSQLQAIRTYPEQVRSYLAALNNGGSSGEFGDLEKAAEEEWPVLKTALISKEVSRK